MMQYVCVIDQPCSVKMAGYWPSSFLLRFYGTRPDKIEVHNNAKKPISSHLDRTSLVNKGFIIWPKGYTKEFRFCEIKRAIQDGPIMPARVANQNTGFASSCLLAEPAMQ